MKINLNKDPELLGIFGFSWPEKVASFMVNDLKGSGYEDKIKSFWGGSGKNVELVKNLHREYMVLMATGRNPVTFSFPPNDAGDYGVMSPDGILLSQSISKSTTLPMVIIDSFLKGLYVLSRDGKIPYEKYNPKGYQESKKITKEAFVTEEGFFDKLKPAGDSMKTVLTIGIIGVSAYLLNQVKGIFK